MRRSRNIVESRIRQIQYAFPFLEIDGVAYLLGMTVPMLNERLLCRANESPDPLADHKEEDPKQK